MCLPIIETSDFSYFPRARHPTLVLLPGKFSGRRSLVGCSPWGRKELDTTDRLHFHFHFSLSCIREGNGNRLQCSCLENPRNGGAWWTAVYGVAQSQTRLKRLSSSSSRSSLHHLYHIFVNRYKSFPSFLTFLPLFFSLPPHFPQGHSRAISLVSL